MDGGSDVVGRDRGKEMSLRGMNGGDGVGWDGS